MQEPFGNERKLLSVWNIVKDFRACQFYWLSHELLRLEKELSGPVSAAWVHEQSAMLDYIKGQCDHIGLKLTDVVMLPLCKIGSELQRFTLAHNYIVDVEEIKRQFRALRENLEHELNQRRFVQVARENTKYFEQEKLFGDAVYNKFEKARQDIKDAGNCLAAGLPIACVFYLTRVSEIGLRYIAAKVGVKLTDKGKPQAVEYATWDKVINGIQSKIAQAKTLPQGPRKARKLSFFSDAAEQCSYIKEIWRNEVSHTRKRYNENEALGAMQRIKSFMELLTGEPQ